MYEKGPGKNSQGEKPMTMPKTGWESSGNVGSKGGKK